MKIVFPPQKGYVQTNRSNFLGSLWATFNIDLQSNLGVARIGSKMKVNSNTATLSNLGTPVVFKHYAGKVWTIGDTRVFKSSVANNIIAPFIEDTSTGAVTLYSSQISDMEVFNNKLFTTGNDTHVYNYSSATTAWTDMGSILHSASYHKLGYFKSFDRLYVLDTSTTILSFDVGLTLTALGDDYSLDLTNAVSQITTFVCSTNYVWIGTIHSSNNTTANNLIEKCAVYQWDGISSQPTGEYLIDAQGVLAITIRNNLPHIMDSNGVLRAFTGSYFKEIGRLPLNKRLLINAEFSGTNRFIHPNGIVTTKNDTIQILVNNQIGDNAGSIQENLPSGIWEWSKDNGFVHLSSLTYMPVSSSTITDYGQNRISGPGALSNANIYSTSSSGRSTIIAGADYFTDSSTVTSAIFVDSPIPTDNTSTPEGQKKGYFVTTFFLTSEIESKWERLWNIHKLFKNSTDSIVFKYRLYEEEPIQASITWVDTTHFTTTTDVTAYWTSGIGGEVEIVQGTGGGSCSHIINIVNNAGTYTITLDNPVTGVTTGTALARFQKWIKINPEISGTIKEWEQMAILSNSSMIQIKGCLTWTGDGEFIKMAIASNEDIKINK